MTRMIRLLGRRALAALKGMGRMGLFLLEACYYTVVPPFKFRYLLRQIRFFGNYSFLVILLTGAFTGMVLALQIFYVLRQFGSEAMLGPAVALSVIRELGPVLAALMVTGRAGSALTAEIGIMRITEQIDALVAMALNPLRYLVVPNFVAALIVFPLLTAIFDLIAIYGGKLVAVDLLGLSVGTYYSQIKIYVDMEDIRIGLYKALCFGIIVAWVCCYKGYYAEHGAEGVGRATTAAVVTSSILVLIGDYFLGSILL